MAIAAAALVALSLSAGATAADAATSANGPDTWSPWNSVTFQVPASGVDASGARVTSSTITCSVSVDNAHYSPGSSGVIAKIRAKCSGTCGCAPTVSVRVQGLLSYSTTQTPLSKYRGVRSTDVTKVFHTDGSLVTTYIPQLDENGYPANGWYLATGTLDPAAAPAVSATSEAHVTNVP